MDISLLYKRVEGTLTAEEEKDFSQWIAESPLHQRYFESFERRIAGEERYILTDSLRASSRERFLQRINQQHHSRSFSRYIVRFSRIAAIFVIAGVVAHYLFRTYITVSPVQEGVSVELLGEKVADAVSAPMRQAHHGVVLIDAKGENIPYEQLDAWSKSNGMELNTANALLSYASDPSEASLSEEEQYNEIVVSKGTEFSVILSDGTQVWLNADSRLKYPIQFHQGVARRVYLQGEAYFDVSADSLRPFIVTAAHTDITAYGTEFNIYARKDDYVRATLVDGVVAVCVEGDTCHTRLAPGQTAKVDLLNGCVALKEEPIELHVGWKQGKYHFEETTLKELFAELALWYDVEVVFTDESLENERFTGCLSRHTSLDRMLRILQETTYLTSAREGKRLVIGRGDSDE